MGCWISTLSIRSRSKPPAIPAPRAARCTEIVGKGRFEDVTDKAGVGHPGWGMGVCTADVDGDGWEDLYVTALGGNKYYRNNRDGTFADLTAAAGLTAGGWSAGCGFADYDRDGDLDLFVSRYVRIDLANLPQFGKDKTCEYRGVAVQCGPRGLPGESDFLFRNEGNGRFSDVSQHAGVSDPREYFGLGIGWFDYDEDGWLDLYVANDSTPNYLYHNQKNGTFKEIAFPMGVAVSQDGAEQGSMGVAIGDYDNSGRFSVWVTNFSEEYNALYRNNGDHFTDTSFRSKTAAVSLPFVGWGNAFFDYDNDGLLDMIVVNGHVYPQLDKARLRASAGYGSANSSSTIEATAHSTRWDRAGQVVMEERVSRGFAVGDLDNDGRLDVVINDLDGSPQVLRNEIDGAGNWLIGETQRQGPEHRGDRRGRHGARRRRGAETSGAERQQLHFSGRQAPPLRARQGRGGHVAGGPLAGRDHDDVSRRQDESDPRGAAVDSSSSAASGAAGVLGVARVPRWWRAAGCRTVGRPSGRGGLKIAKAIAPLALMPTQGSRRG